MGVHQTVHCVLCGFDVKPERLGLQKDGQYNEADAPQHEMSVRLTDIGGRGHIAVTRVPLPMEFAYGLRRALQVALARVEGEIAASGGETGDDAT
jgi:hypothetical protein